MAIEGKKINELDSLTTVTGDTVLPVVYVSGQTVSETAQKVSISQISNKVQNDLADTLALKQDKLTAGTGIEISNTNVITATGSVQNIETVSSSSGTIALETNKVYKINLTGNTIFTLPSTVDNTIFNQIYVQLNITGDITVNLGTTNYFTEEVELESGLSWITYEYNSIEQAWYVGKIGGESGGESGGGTDLKSIDGYDANVPVQRLTNLGGNFKWQTKSVIYNNFNQYNYLTPKITWPDAVSTVDFILEVVAFIPNTGDHAQNIITFGDTSNPHSLFYGSYQHNPRGGFGYWNGSSNIWYVDAITQTPATKWIRLTGTNGNMSVYCIDDNNYTLETLPELANWTYQGVCPETLGNSSHIQFNFAASTACFYGTLKNWQIKANNSVVFDLRNDNSVELSNSNTQAYMGIKLTEYWN